MKLKAKKAGHYTLRIEDISEVQDLGCTANRNGGRVFEGRRSGAEGGKIKTGGGGRGGSGGGSEVNIRLNHYCPTDALFDARVPKYDN